MNGITPYWLVVTTPDLLNTAFDWKIAAMPLVIPQSGRLGADPWPSANPNQALAFRINGVATPEASTWILAGVGLLLLSLGQFVRRRSLAPSLEK